MNFREAVKAIMDEMEGQNEVAEFTEAFGDGLGVMIAMIRTSIDRHLHGMSVALYMAAHALAKEEEWKKVAENEHQAWALIADYGNINESPMWGQLASRWKNAVRVLARIIQSGMEESMDIDRLAKHLERGYDSLVIRDLRDTMAHYDKTAGGVIPRDVLQNLVKMINGQISHAEYVQEAQAAGVSLSQARETYTIFCSIKEEGRNFAISLRDVDENTREWLRNALTTDGLAIGRGKNRMVIQTERIDG